MSEEVKYELCRPDGMSQTDWDKITEIVRKDSIDFEYGDSDFIIFTGTRRGGMTCEEIMNDCFKEFKGSELEVRAWYMEREPDDVFDI